MRSGISLIITLFLVCAVYAPLHQAAAQMDCPGAPPPHLVSGMQAQVIVQGEGLEGLLRVRDHAGVASEALVDLENGDTFSVIGGPECADSYAWWNIVTGGGITGWVAEGTPQNYFVEPLADPNPDPLPAAPDRLVTRLGNGTAYSAAWSPDGQLLAVAGSRGVWLFTPDLEAIQLLEGPGLAEVAWSPDGTRLVGAGADGTLPIWDMTTRQVILSISGHPDPVRAVSWSADGQFLASVSGEPAVRVWNAATGAPLKTLDLPGEAESVRWNPVANQLAASYFVEDLQYGLGEDLFAVQIWEGETFDPIRQIDEAFAVHIRWSADGTQVAILDTYQGISITTVSDGTQTEVVTNLGIGGDSDLSDLAWTPDGSFVLGSSYVWAGGGGSLVERGVSCGTIESTNLIDCNFSVRYEVPSGRRIHSLAWRPGSNQLAVIDDDFISLLDGDTLTLLKEQEAFPFPNFAWDQAGQPTLSESAPEPDRLKVTLDYEQSILQVQDPATGQTLFEIPDFCSEMGLVYAFNPDQSRLVLFCAPIYLVSVWDVAPGMKSQQDRNLLDDYNISIICEELDWTSGRYCDLYWSPDSRYFYLVGTDWDYQWHSLFWDTQSGDPLLNLTTGVEDLKWSPDSRYFAYFWGSELAVWDTTTWQSVESPEDAVSCLYGCRLIWSPDSIRLASAEIWGGNSVLIWDAATAHISLELIGHTSGITVLSWSPDGARLASGDRGGTVRIWDAANGQLLLTLPGHLEAIQYLYWKPDSSQLAVVSGDRTARVWDVR